jgi:hypothetical protein
MADIADLIKKLMELTPTEFIPSPVQYNLYWDARHPNQGGTGRVIRDSQYPGAGHYRLTDSFGETQDALDAQEPPLLVGSAIHDMDPDEDHFDMLAKLQEKQYANPGGTPMFAPDDSGRLSFSPGIFPAEDDE